MNDLVVSLQVVPKDELCKQYTSTLLALNISSPLLIYRFGDSSPGVNRQLCYHCFKKNAMINCWNSGNLVSQELSDYYDIRL